MTTKKSWATRFIEGSADAFDELVKQNQSGLLRVSQSILKDESMAQDAVQETFIRLLKHYKAIEDGSKLKSWLYRTCRNVSIDFIRKEQRIKSLSDKICKESETATPSPEKAVEEIDNMKLIHKTIKKLTYNERHCILLKMIEEKSYKEIATITGLSISSVGFQIHNGLKRLASFLKM